MLMNYVNNINLIDKEVLILSILIFLGCLAQIKYMIDYNRDKLSKEKYPIFTMMQYIWLSISAYSVIGIGSSNSYTLDYGIKSHGIIRILGIIIVLLSIFTIIKHWSHYNNKLKQLIVSVLIIILIPIGFIISVGTPIISLITIPYKYLKHHKLDKDLTS